MASIRNEIPVAAPPGQVWDALRDFGAVHTRVVPGFVVECRLDGETREVTFASGLVARESLVDADDQRRRLAYAIVGGRPSHYHASVEVLERSGGGSTIVWIIDLLPNEMAPAVSALAAGGVAAMQRAFGRP
jgi:carbon monoxide dehydrogenase subunit G